MHEILQANALSAFAMTGHASEIGLTAAAVEKILARLVHLAFFRMAQRNIHLHAVRARSNVDGKRFHVRAVGERWADGRLDDLFSFETLQLDHAREEPRLEVLNLVGVREITRQLSARSFELARTQAEVALLERGFLR